MNRKRSSRAIRWLGLGLLALCARLARLPPASRIAQTSGGGESIESWKDLCASINDAASKASAVWTTFVTFELYLAISIASISQRDLLFETPVDLPLLSVKLPLSGFFLVAPALFVVFHFYLFLTLRLLASPISAFNRILDRLPPAERETLRQRLDKFFFVQFLAGATDSRQGFVGFALRAIAWFTTVAAPVMILLQCQAKFLPFHDEFITNLHRIFLVLDLLIILYFWRETRKEDDAITGSGWTSFWTGAGIAISAAFAICSIFVLTYPGEMLYKASLFDTFDAMGRENSWFPNRIVLDADGTTGSDKAGGPPAIRSLARRDLRFAVIRRSDLRTVNLSGAHLDYAVLKSVDLRGAAFGCPARPREVAPRTMNFPEQCASWRAAETGCASLSHVDIEDSKLQGAELNGAELPFAVLKGTNLQGASLAGADLQGASLRGAKLEGAMMPYARLTGADLTRTGLAGALLDGAILWGAELRDADMSGTSVRHADLQGVRLAHTTLAGASLSGAAAYMAFTYEYMTDDARSLNDGVIDVDADFSGMDTTTDPRRFALATHRSGLLHDACIDIAEARARDWLERLPRTPSPDGRVLDAEARLRSLDERPKGGRSWPDGNRHEPERKGTEIAALACKVGSAPYAARGLIANGRLSSLDGASASALIDRLQKAAHAKEDAMTDCDGGRGLDGIDAILLEGIKEKIAKKTR